MKCFAIENHYIQKLSLRRWYMNFTADSIAMNLGILLFGCTSVWLIGRPESWRRWGYFLGLCSQPFWFYMAYIHADWGVLILNCLYTYSWTQGVWFHWFKPERVQPEDRTLA